MSKLNYETIERRIGYVFKDKSLLYNAFVHSSYANEHGIADNERMEFFGDAILEKIVSEYLYVKYPEKSAGQLSQARAFIVSAQGLKKAVRRLDILQYLLMSQSSERIRKQSKKIEANLFEAVLCAVYLDGGMDCAQKFAIACLKEYMDDIDNENVVDYKTILQEYCQHNKKEISYVEVSRTGPDNKPSFQYALYLDGVEFATATGSNIKRAQAAAAKIACKKLGIN